MVCLLRVLQLNPLILLLDESTSALDMEIAMQVEWLIDKWMQMHDETRAYVWISHDELLLSLGATRWEAYKEPAQNAVMAGMMPTINSMMGIGLVSLPVMVTGQILAGQDPEQAIRYQIIVMFFLGASTSIGCVLAVTFVFRRLFSTSHNFMYWKRQEK